MKEWPCLKNVQYIVFRKEEKIAPDCIRRDFNRIVWEVQSCRVRPTLGNREESGPIAWKTRVVWEGSHTTRFFHPIPSHKIYVPFLSNPINVTFNVNFNLKKMKNDKISICRHIPLYLTFSIIINVIMSTQWESVMIATSRLLLFV